MLQSGISDNFDRMMQSPSFRKSISIPIHNSKDATGSQVHSPASCPSNSHWNDEGLERDLYIQTSVVTVLAMDGQRRWLDIQKLTVSGRPPPTVSMAVGQFFNPEEAEQEFSPWFMFQSIYSHKEMLLKEAHPLAINLSFAVSLGLLPVTLSLKIASCGIRNFELPEEEAGDLESSRLCKLRCFPPVALAWDDTSGLHIYPNLYSETIFVDSSPAHWSSTQHSQQTIVLLLVDPLCSYKSSIAVSVSAAASRFLLLYSPQIVGFSIAVIFFALMRQAYASDFDLRIPSMLTALESNLTMRSHLLPLAIVPIFISFFLPLLTSQPFFPFAKLHQHLYDVLRICKRVHRYFDFGVSVGILCDCYIAYFHQNKVANVGTKCLLYISSSLVY